MHNITDSCIWRIPTIDDDVKHTVLKDLEVLGKKKGTLVTGIGSTK